MRDGGLEDKELRENIENYDEEEEECVTKSIENLSKIQNPANEDKDRKKVEEGKKRKKEE